MKRSLLTFFLLAAIVQAAPIQWREHYGAAFAEAKREGKILMLFLVQSHCGVCKRMEEGAFADPGVAEAVNRVFVPARLPIRSSELPEEYRAEMSPVLTFIDPEADEIVEQVTGGRSAERLLELLQRVEAESEEAF